MKMFVIAFLFLHAFCLKISHATPIISRPEIVFSDPAIYAAFPSIAKNSETNELFLSFRTAKKRERLSHVDKTGEVNFWRSSDKGNTWTTFSKFSIPDNSIQEASLFMTPENKLLAHSYQWNHIFPGDHRFSHLSETFGLYGGKIFAYDFQENKWEQGILPGIPQNYATHKDIPVPSFNRGTIAIDDNGRYYMAGYIFDSPLPSKKLSTYLLISDDKGMSWKVKSLIATHRRASLSETSIYITPQKTIVAFIRYEKKNKKVLAIARSYNMGKSFERLEVTNVIGHPFNPIKMKDNKILLTYGRRTFPYGIRSLVLDPEAKHIDAKKEIILRDDGKRGDLGYPWVVNLEGNTYLVVYYILHKDISTIMKQTITF